MSLLHQSDISGKRVPKWVVILRVVLGICLIYKGIDFLLHFDQLEAYFAGSKTLQSLAWMVKILPWVHIIGGAMILVGLLTRLMALVQIPIIVGAIVFVNMNTEPGKMNQAELPLSFLMLVLVIVFFIEGGGYLSLDNKIRKPVNAPNLENS
ncbi:MAG: DoxX family protein [Chitinophagaceae bacterium]|nr:DoxX family protein [Bacteroidota bacterium]MCC6257169.1 DoxX family protein [Chitinophagaceae bacterium]MCW5916663.1 DoxX family protein [Ferruginibacter sp.]